MSKLHVATSPLTGRIYLGKISKSGDTWLNRPAKQDVTGEACAAVAIHTLMQGGTTVVTANGVPTYEITARKIDADPNKV